MIEIEERHGNRIELTLVGFCECPTCGRDCTEIWQDGSGRNRLRCQNHECESYGELRLQKTGGAMHLTPEQAIAATVGMEKWEPSKEWKAWHNSLKHDNPTSIREAVENILYEAIDFGGDMGPNGNVWSGVDEGTVLTENCIDGWVESVESIAATVTTEPDEATMLKLHDRMNAALLDYESEMGIDGGNGANAVPFVNEMHQIIEDAAKVGVGTCEGSFHESSDLSSGMVPLYYCKATNKSIFIEREARFCPLCGRRIEEESE